VSVNRFAIKKEKTQEGANFKGLYYLTTKHIMGSLFLNVSYIYDANIH
jgi:hypothetical protein